MVLRNLPALAESQTSSSFTTPKETSPIPIGPGFGVSWCEEGKDVNSLATECSFHIPRAYLTPVFGLRPFKIKPFTVKTRVKHGTHQLLVVSSGLLIAMPLPRRCFLLGSPGTYHLEMSGRTVMFFSDFCCFLPFSVEWHCPSFLRFCLIPWRHLSQTRSCETWQLQFPSFVPLESTKKSTALHVTWPCWDFSQVM